jgi:hypothetical protein
MYIDPIAQDLAWEQGRRDQCVRIGCWVVLILFIIFVVIWLISWIRRPKYFYQPAGHIYVRHNLIDLMHQSENGYGHFFSS